MVRRFDTFCQNIFRKERVELELDEEIRSYLALVAAEKVRCGRSPGVRTKTIPVSMPSARNREIGRDLPNLGKRERRHDRCEAACHGMDCCLDCRAP